MPSQVPLGHLLFSVRTPRNALQSNNCLNIDKALACLVIGWRTPNRLLATRQARTIDSGMGSMMDESNIEKDESDGDAVLTKFVENRNCI